MADQATNNIVTSKLQPVNVLHYPSDIPDKCIVFSFEKYSWDAISSGNYGVEAKSTVNVQNTIALPIPAQLVDNTQVMYNGVSLGNIGKTVTDKFGSMTPDSAMNDVNNIVDQASKTSASQIYGAIKNALTSPTADALGYQMYGGALSTVHASPNLANGTIVNPESYQSFEGVGLKTHNFSWDFVPLSADESATLANIIYKFKYHQLPGIDAKYFQYPELVKIALLPEAESKYLYKFKRCFLAGVSVNYSPYGPSFFMVSGAPVAVNLTITLVETSVWVKSNLDDTVDMPSNSGGTFTGWVPGQALSVVNQNRTLSGSTTGIGGLMGIVSSFGGGKIAQIAGSVASVTNSAKKLLP